MKNYKICGDEIEFSINGEPFGACNQCAFPICRICYEYERREGNQACPLWLYAKPNSNVLKSQSGWDEDEDEFDDLEHEFEHEEHALPSNDILRRPMDPSNDSDAHGYGTLVPKMDEGRRPLSRKVPIPSSKISPYRIIILLRMAILVFFFHYRIQQPPKDAHHLWLASIICELWFVVAWLFDQLPKWNPVTRETYLDRLSLRYEKEGKPSELACIDIFVSMVDPLKEPPLITANTVLSILHFLSSSSMK